MYNFNVVDNKGVVYYTTAASPSAAIKRAGIDPNTVKGVVWGSNRRGRKAGLYGTAQLTPAQLADYD